MLEENTMFAEHYTTTVGPVEITVAPPEQPPWDVDAIVEEQDTRLLHGDPHLICDTTESYETLIGKMQDQAPLVPGQVIVKHTAPRRFIAIVYDIDRKPMYRMEWITTALEKLLRETETYKVRRIAMPLLGVTHGRCPDTKFMDLLCTMLPGVHAGCPEKLWLVTSLAEYRNIIAYFEGGCL